MSQKQLAAAVGYTPSYVSKVENGHQPPSAEFADGADKALNAGGAIRRAYAELRVRTASAKADGDRGPAQSLVDPNGPSLVVEHDDAELRYDGRTYLAIQRRRLRNVGNEPVSQFKMRISADSFPGNPERSLAHYRANPLTWEELDLQACCGDEPMRWRVQHDKDSLKEVWLLFENEHGRFPLYPGESTDIEYSYSVPDTKWGPWFQRTVRHPTERLSVRLVFPADLEPSVWGIENTMSSSEPHPFRTAIDRREEDGRLVFAWSTESPLLPARYRLEWRFKARPATDQGDEHMSPIETMKAMGVVQEGDPILASPARRFDLPAEADEASQVVAELQAAIVRISEVHNFGKGMGIAAPQIGIDRSAALVRLPDGDTITLLNARVIEESADTDEQYEGCLSFFDVRGMVPRPLSIHVEHQKLDGQTRITRFDRGAARLIAHEIDHLDGQLYKARMREGVQPIPITEYRGGGEQWRY